MGAQWCPCLTTNGKWTTGILQSCEAARLTVALPPGAMVRDFLRLLIRPRIDRKMFKCHQPQMKNADFQKALE